MQTRGIADVDSQTPAKLNRVGYLIVLLGEIVAPGQNVYAHTELLKNCDERQEMTQDLIMKCLRTKNESI